MAKLATLGAISLALGCRADAAPVGTTSVEADLSAGGGAPAAPSGALVAGYRVGGGRGLEIQGGGLRVDLDPRPPVESCDYAVLEVHADPSEIPVTLEFELHDEVRRSRWWTRETVSDPGWQRIELPLAAFRYDRGRVPRWEDVTSWGIGLRSHATVSVAGVEFRRDHTDATAYLGLDELRDLAFGPDQVVTVVQRWPFVVMTDEPRLDTTAVIDALSDMRERTAKRFPDLPDAGRPVPLLVFANERDYRAFWPRFSTMVDGDLPKFDHDGYTWLGVGSAWYSSRYGAVRPTYVHEASHALMVQKLGLSVHGSWLFEGLASLDQVEVSGQDLAAVYQIGINKSDARIEIPDLVSGASIPEARYWKAALLLEWMFADHERTVALRTALDDMRELGSVDLRPLAQKHFGMSLERLEREFLTWAQRTYG